MAILEVLWDVEFLRLDTQDRRVTLRPKFIYWLLRYWQKGSRLAAWIAATSQVTGARVILGMDNFDLNQHSKSGPTLYEELGSILPNVEILSIQHGQELRRFTPSDRKKRVKLLCWGDWVSENFPKFGRTEGEFVSVGALVDGLYRKERPAAIEKDVKICLISTIKDRTWWGSEIGERRSGYESLVEYLRLFAQARGISPHVALTIRRDQNTELDEVTIERNWFLERLGGEINFTEPKLIFGSPHPQIGELRQPKHIFERYSTYYLCDRSEVTLGMTSSVLWESFGRGNKVLAVNLTDNPIYDFPIPGVWSMRQPTYAKFENRLQELLRMPDEQWEQESREARNHLMTYNPDCPPHVEINQEIKRALARKAQ
jgi:hypothetical protein